MNLRIGDRWGRVLDKLTFYQAPRVLYKIERGIWFPTGSEMFHGVYEKFPDFLPKKNDKVIDVGAQYGDYSIVCKKIYGANPVAFEPLPKSFSEMKKCMARNNVSFQTMNLALSDKRESLEMYTDGDQLRTFTSEVSRRDLITVHFEKLDSLSFEPDILKIDVEGFEMHVLKGSIETILKYKPRIIMEAHSSLLEKEVRDFLKSVGYSDPKEFGRRPGKGWMDSTVNLFFKHE